MSRRLKKYLLYSIVIIGGLLLVINFEHILAIAYSTPWTGLGAYTAPNGDVVREKTLWEWMELLIVPLVLAGGAFFLQRSERAVERKIAEDRAIVEREIASDRQQEAALQAYLDRMAELLLQKNLRTSENEEVRNVARTRTLTVLRILDPTRKGLVVRFLHESGLLAQERVVDLRVADLSGANLRRARLSEANLIEANLSGANLSGAHLSGADLRFASLPGANLSGAQLSGAHLGATYLMEADLSGANLSGADLRGAYLGGANLSGAHLSGADLQAASLPGADLSGADLTEANLDQAEVTDKQWATAESLKGAIMPDGTKHQ